MQSTFASVTFKGPTSQDGQTPQTIRRLLPTICLSVFDHFVSWRFKGSTSNMIFSKVHRRVFRTLSNIYDIGFFVKNS